VPPVGLADWDDTQPAWSPDGTTLAFTRGLISGTVDDEVRDTHIWTARAEDLGGQRDLTRAVCGGDCRVADDSAAFAPDGRRLAFNRESDGLLVVSADGDECRVLLPQAGGSCAGPVPGAPGGPYQPRDAAWSPDGGALVFSTRTASSPGAPEALSIMELDSGAQHRLTWSLPGRQKEPDWQRTTDLRTELARAPEVGVVGTPVSVAVTVTNRGPAPSPDTVLTFAVPRGLRLTAATTDRGGCLPAEARCELGLLEPDAVVRVTAQFDAATAGTRRVTWSVAGAVLDPNLSDNHAAVDVRFGEPTPPPPPAPPPSAPPPAPPSPGLSVVVQPDPSYVGGTATVTYTVRNGGGQPAVGLRLALRPPAGVPVRAAPPGCAPTDCFLGDLPPGGVALVQLVLAPDAPGVTDVSGLLTTTGPDADPRDNAASAPMRVLLPRIVAVPPIGKPGFVTSVRGVDFPPGVPVRLLWSAGITAAAAPTIPRPDGTFAGQLLILTKDQLGPRLITASGPGFAPASTPFLVVAGSVGPPDFVMRR
jgi:hypothetical protein